MVRLVVKAEPQLTNVGVSRRVRERFKAHVSDNYVSQIRTRMWQVELKAAANRQKAEAEPPKGDDNGPVSAVPVEELRRTEVPTTLDLEGALGVIRALQKLLGRKQTLSVIERLL